MLQVPNLNVHINQIGNGKNRDKVGRERKQEGKINRWDPTRYYHYSSE